MHLSYSAIVDAAKSSLVHPHDFTYAVVELGEGDSTDNPASTKRLIYGPGVWMWEVHASGITAREYDSVVSIPAELRDGAARL